MFEVARDSNKVQIRDAVQKLFNVTVTNVNTLVMRCLLYTSRCV